MPLTSPPGRRFDYNNTGYALLALLIEKVSGKPWDAFLADRIFGPLGMSATRLDHPDMIISNRAAGYQCEGSPLGGGRPPHDKHGLINSYRSNPTIWFNGSGGLVSTVLDIAKWDAALRSKTLLNAHSLEEMWTAARLDDDTLLRTFRGNEYGLGWFLDVHRGHRVVTHSGGLGGFATCITRFPARDLSIIVLANREGGNPTSLANEVAGFYDPGLAGLSIATANRLRSCTHERLEGGAC
jgi:D-alanyl-D-alanine carboxypeptidase